MTSGFRPALPDAAEENADHSVLILELRTLSPAAESLELVAEGDVLEDQCLAVGTRYWMHIAGVKG
jgi:hypothetical protein